MEDIIMVFGIYLFALLFLFLLSVFIISLLAMFKRERDSGYEPKVSVIIPCYNEEKRISDCLDALFNSDYPKEKLEVIIVDDGSKDKTLKILSAYKKDFPSLVILKNIHEGKSLSLNKGVKKASQGVIFTLDADTVIGKSTLRKLVQPLAKKEVGATNGSCIVRNKTSLLGVFQNLEYHYNNLVRKSFSLLFGNAIWFFGAFACYKKHILDKTGGFKTDTMTEDTDTALEISALGYRVVNVHDAFGYVLAPSGIRELVRERTRWWIGVLQALKKNKKLFSFKSSPSILFLFLNQYWWSFYALAFFPLLAYQFNYWLSYNLGSFYSLFMYTFRWFTLLGPFYVLYKIPEWGVSLYSIFGVLSGILTTALILEALFVFKEKIRLRSIIGVFFYFPYTIVLNIIIVISLLKLIFLKRKYFIN
jgi:cellulose synthase/poly-beta-1,6-N-acetylglucosamine synthase-like glycosyltransferase